MRIPIWSILLIIFIIIVCSATTHVVDVWMVPVQNEITTDQLNGGDGEFITRTTGNEFLIQLRSWINPIGAVLVLAIIVKEVTVSLKKSKRDEEYEDDEMD